MQVRETAVAGLFYPRDARVLRSEVDRLLERAASGDASRIAPKILLVPHAGYVYSGAIAAAAFGRLAPLRETIRTVVLLGPAHREAIRGLAHPSVDAFATPLGEVPIDRDRLASIAGLPQVDVSDSAHALEHALEVQLPFLQTVLERFALVPLVVGRASAQDVAEVIERLWGGPETLIVVSTDLSHYHADADARRLDAATIGAILALDPRLDHRQACGATPVNGALLCAARHGLRPRLLEAANSGRVNGDANRVVGYCAVAFEPAHAQEVAAGEAAADIRTAARTSGRPGVADARAGIGAAMLAHARSAISARLGVESPAGPPHPVLEAPGASFVTLTIDGRLRGCIGSLQAHRPLGEDVRANAVAAAFRDPRFPALSAHELRTVRVEVSVLDAPVPMPVDDEADALARLRPGVDGLILGWQGRRATFLPQVWESLPEPAEFLRQLKRKAGLPEDFWAPDVELARYAVRKWVERAGESPKAAS